jgi:hypothetical protein
MIYEPGEQVELYADIFPSSVTPRPEGWPLGAKVRTIISERCLTMAWQAGDQVYRIDLPMTEEETSLATFRGGPVGEYEVARAGGCRCGSKLVLAWEAFPGVIWVQDPRMDLVRPNMSGLVPPRYSRS